MLVQVFDDRKSLFHFLLGFITPIWPRFGLITALVYFLWQSWETEKLKNKKGDVLEYLTGAGGWALVHTILAVV